MINRVCVFLILTLISLTFGTGKPAFAASQDECAIWLCLPGGFPQGCGAAHSAMIKRIKNANRHCLLLVHVPRVGAGIIKWVTSRLSHAKMDLS